MSFSNYAEQQALAAVLDGSFVGLATSTPTDGSPGTEVSGNGYARQSWAPAYTQGSPTEANNSSAVEFPAATAGWGTITYAMVFDAASGGNFLGYLELRDPNDTGTPLSKEVSSGDILRFPAGALVFTMD